MSEWLRAIGLNVLLARTGAGKTQSQLGVSPTTVKKFEDGKGGTLLSVEKISKAVGVTPTELVTASVHSKGDPSVGTEEVIVIRTPQQHVIWGVMQQLTAADLTAFQKVATEFLHNRQEARRKIPARRHLHQK